MRKYRNKIYHKIVKPGRSEAAADRPDNKTNQICV